jgi:ParB-like nuclease domain
MAMALKVVKPTKLQKVTRTTVDTIVVTPESVKQWNPPPFQRPKKVNQKVRDVVETLKENGGVLPGFIEIGVLHGQQYLLDGQHRMEAFLLSGLEEGYCDVRYLHFDSMADMSDEFVNVNSRLVNFRPDDILRGLEASSESISLIRMKAPFVGYDQIRRGPSSPILSMSAVIRCWAGSVTDVPKAASGSAQALAKDLTVEDAQTCVDFLHLAEKAWGKDPEYARLWGNLNLTLCMWLYRRLVITPYSPRTPKLTKDMFTKCLMSVSAATAYVEWLVGRQLSERDRSPAYARIKREFAKRIEEETGKKALMPSPSWYQSH